MKTHLLAALLALSAPFAHADNTSAARSSLNPSLAAEFPMAQAFADGIAARLDLSAAQRAELKAAVRAHKPALAPLVDALRDEHQAWLDYSRAHADDVAGLAAQADRVLAAQKKLMLEGASLRRDMRKVLTPDQLAKFDALREENHGRFAKLRARFQAWLGQS
jgi:Spy/CpxP family protein refolding chaperone